MQNQNQFNNTDVNSSIQASVEQIWQNTCGSWEKFNQSAVQKFLSQCEERGIDPQFAMSWIEKSKDKVPDWQTVSRVSLDWINQHTASGSPLSNETLK
ncbi:hypothetical protein AF332_17865 [Sporosarcina globispora]|uniref:Uncharacterized protein n=1 Tax=Sporosarcina globispora TaxID=1459 RepID=A0A0M0GF14_SPOGL|nr:hypothetical protein [Sporosarcina globispora]KON88495.1 hypothetical protein AF332_17865 [Sporosarcina globispora]